jgi:monothiol glutaredoxin
MTKTFNDIENYLNQAKVVLFMKGTKDFPLCGFSGKVVFILQELGVDFLDVNVLENEDLREDIKLFSNWPTIPQLYIKKVFIGGCDIVSSLYDKGELENLLYDNN